MTLAAAGYKHLPVGHPDNPKPFEICGAHTHGETSARLCTLRAGWGTTHPGVGRCKLHGGSSPIGPDHPNWTGGRYAHAWRGRMAQAFRELQQDQSDPLDLLPELQVQRVLLSLAIEDLAADEPSPERAELLTDAAQLAADEQEADADKVDHVAETRDQIVSPVGVVGGMSISPHKVSSSHPPGAKLLIDQEKLTLVNDLAGDIVKTVTQVIQSRNQTALTVAEVKWLRMKMVEAGERFFPDPEQRRAYLAWIAAELPAGGNAGEPEGSAGAAEVQTAG